MPAYKPNESSTFNIFITFLPWVPDWDKLHKHIYACETIDLLSNLMQVPKLVFVMECLVTTYHHQQKL